jgi:hypothetical protein
MAAEQRRPSQQAGDHSECAERELAAAAGPSSPRGRPRGAATAHGNTQVADAPQPPHTCGTAVALEAER